MNWKLLQPSRKSSGSAARKAYLIKSDLFMIPAALKFSQGGKKKEIMKEKKK